jgi:hypothetical protein
MARSVGQQPESPAKIFGRWFRIGTLISQPDSNRMLESVQSNQGILRPGDMTCISHARYKTDYDPVSFKASKQFPTESTKQIDGCDFHADPTARQTPIFLPRKT